MPTNAYAYGVAQFIIINTKIRPTLDTLFRCGIGNKCIIIIIYFVPDPQFCNFLLLLYSLSQESVNASDGDSDAGNADVVDREDDQTVQAEVDEAASSSGSSSDENDDMEYKEKVKVGFI